MKVLHLLKTSTGATWALRQLRELVRLGIDVHVALPAGPLIESYQEYGITTHILQTAFDAKRPWNNFKRFKDFRILVDVLQPDIIHSHFVATTLTMRLALGKNHAVKRIFHVPGPLHLEHFFFRKMEMLTAGKADYWLASCRWTADAYLRFGVPVERVGLVYYGVDLDKFTVVERCGLRQELGLDEDTKIIGNVAYFYAPKKYLGQTRGLKGHEDLIDAIEIVANKHPNVVGVFVGGPWGNAKGYEQEVISYAKKKGLGRFFFLGFRDDVQQLYHDFTISVHPSHSENVGGAVESLLCESPTIATDVGGFPDLIKPGITGWLVPPKTPEALAETILEAFENPEKCQIMVQEGRKLAEKMFDVRQNANDIFTYYQRLLGHDELGAI
ncbi:MAG: glycosyltransferase family 4 protein [Pseudomonadales bacterium]